MFENPFVTLKRCDTLINLKTRRRFFMKKILMLFLIFGCWFVYAPYINASPKDSFEQVVTEQKNVALIRNMLNHLYDVWASAEKSNGLFDQIFSPKFVFEGIGIKEDYNLFRKHFSGNYKSWKSVDIKILDLFGHDNKVALRGSVKGVTKKGDVYRLNLISIFQIENGKITHWWDEEFPNSQEILKKVGEKY